MGAKNQTIHIEKMQVCCRIDMDVITKFFQKGQGDAATFPMISHGGPVNGQVGMKDGKPRKVCGTGIGKRVLKLDVFLGKLG